MVTAGELTKITTKILEEKEAKVKKVANEIETLSKDVFKFIDNCLIQIAKMGGKGGIVNLECNYVTLELVCKENDLSIVHVIEEVYTKRGFTFKPVNYTRYHISWP